MSEQLRNTQPTDSQPWPEPEPGDVVVAGSVESIEPVNEYVQKYVEMAHTDELTGLLNRRGLYEALETLTGSPDFDPNRYVLVYLDLNNFKTLNDTYGHEAGDRVLVEVANKLRPNDIAARVGGDELVVVADKYNSAPDRRGSDRDGKDRRRTSSSLEVEHGLAAKVIEVNNLLREDYPDINVSTSAGSQDIDGSIESDELIHVADLRMNHNKQAAKAGR